MHVHPCCVFKFRVPGTSTGTRVPWPQLESLSETEYEEFIDKTDVEIFRHLPAVLGKTKNIHELEAKLTDLRLNSSRQRSDVFDLAVWIENIRNGKPTKNLTTQIYTDIYSCFHNTWSLLKPDWQGQVHEKHREGSLPMMRSKIFAIRYLESDCLMKEQRKSILTTNEVSFVDGWGRF